MRAGCGSAAPADLLLLDSQLGRRQSLEALVGNRLTALGGESEGSRREPRLRALEPRELRGEILCQTRVELFLVQVLGASITRFVLFGSPTMGWVIEPRLQIDGVARMGVLLWAH